MNTTDRANILIVGVGGQGVLLASEVISAVAMNAGLDVKKSEVHGMSQRGGVVSSHVKIAPKVYSPTIGEGQVDVLIAFEQAEGLRAVNWMRKDGLAIVSRTQLIPAIVTGSKIHQYPEDAIGELRRQLNRVIAVAADQIAGELGNSRLVNTILLGVLANNLPFNEELWINTIRAKVKKQLVDINITAFQRGRGITLEQVKV